MQDFRPDLTTFLESYPGAQLRVLVLRNMDEPLEMKYVNEECPNLERLKIMLCGILDSNKGTNTAGSAASKPPQDSRIGSNLLWKYWLKTKCTDLANFSKKSKYNPATKV